MSLAPRETAISRARSGRGRVSGLSTPVASPERSDQPIDLEIRAQVNRAIEEADLLLLVVDAKAGVTSTDAYVVEMLRNAHRPWVLVANKVDDPSSVDYYEFYSLGAGDVVPVSAI